MASSTGAYLKITYASKLGVIIRATKTSISNTSRQLNIFLKSTRRYYEMETESHSVVPKLIIRKLVTTAKVTVVPTKYVLIAGSVSSLKVFASFLDAATSHRHNESFRFDHAFSNNHVSPDSIRLTLMVE